MAVAIMVLPVPVIATTTVDTTVGEAMDMVAR
jgi:tRNA A37 threonylcarbamoyltransferase TsaD